MLAMAALIIFSATYVSGSFSRGGEWGSITHPYRFDIVQWEFQNIAAKWIYLIEQTFHKDPLSDKEKVELVKEFLCLDQEIKRLRNDLDWVKVNGNISAGGIAHRESNIDSLIAERNSLESRVEEIIEGQISGILADEGLSATLQLGGDAELLFPPVDFAFDNRLNVLIVSPRDYIDSIDTTLLRPDMTLEEKIDVETKVEDTGYSALVEQVGAVATYPSTVPSSSSVEYLLSKVAHEWVHHYLFFRPLGQKYWTNYDMTTINETVANIAGRDIGSLTYQRYYAEDAIAEYQKPEDTSEPAFDFSKEMRETRLTVDEYLAQGEIDKAEDYMRERRQFLEDNGYYIRKLNQAYFAFYGTYADAPTSVNPIGGHVKNLREQSTSPGDFIRTASQITSYDDLLKLLNGRSLD
jgi:hypothetical protein